jgi:sugar phosphate permease
MGYTSTTAQLFTVPPNMAAFITVLVTAYYSDKVKNRGYFIIGGSLLGICGYVMLLAAKTNAVRYAGTFLVAIGVFQGSPMIMGWISNNVAPHYVRAVAVGIVISIANCSAFIGTFIYLQRDSPKYTLGHAVSLGALVITVILAVAQVVYLRWENKKRDRGERDGRLVQDHGGSLGHRHPNFRYTL